MTGDKINVFGDICRLDRFIYISCLQIQGKIQLLVFKYFKFCGLKKHSTFKIRSWAITKFISLYKFLENVWPKYGSLPPNLNNN